MQAVMGMITAVILAAFVAYAGAWYTGVVEGNFAVLLMLATVVTGVYWVIEKLVFLPRRRRAASGRGLSRLAQRLVGRATFPWR